MRLYHHFHQNLNHYFHTQLSKLELSVWLHTVGRSLIAIFIPILLLMSGFQLNQVILFLFLFYSMDVPLNFLARKSTLKIGARNTIIIGVVFEIISFVVLYFVAYSWKMLIAFAFTWAMYDTFYWVAHWFIFNECVKVKKGVGKQVGFLFIIRRLGSVASPAIGAIFLIFFAKEYLILVSILFVIISLIPLFSIKLDFMQPKIKQSFKQFFKDKKIK